MYWCGGDDPAHLLRAAVALAQLATLRNDHLRIQEDATALREHLTTVASELDHKALKCIEIREAVDRIRQDAHRCVALHRATRMDTKDALLP